MYYSFLRIVVYVCRNVCMYVVSVYSIENIFAEINACVSYRKESGIDVSKDALAMQRLREVKLILADNVYIHTYLPYSN